MVTWPAATYALGLGLSLALGVFKAGMKDDWVTATVHIAITSACVWVLYSGSFFAPLGWAP